MMVFSQFVKKQYRRWLKKRIPPKAIQKLTHRNIFIVPSKTGLGFIILTIALWLLGTNYQNNLVLGLAYWLLALMVVVIMHTYANLSGLTIQVSHIGHGFVGEKALVDFIVKKNNQRNYDAIDFYWDANEKTTVSLVEKAQKKITLHVPIEYRGWFEPSRITIKTQFPLGLITAWSRQDMDIKVLAYPKPIETNAVLSHEENGTDEFMGQTSLVNGTDEFSGLKEYEAGDSLKRVAWQSFAKGRGLSTKVYENYASQTLWLEWIHFPGLSTEERLSRLCWLTISVSEDPQVEFGLRLPDAEIKPSNGFEHRDDVLKALALYERHSDVVES